MLYLSKKIELVRAIWDMSVFVDGPGYDQRVALAVEILFCDPRDIVDSNASDVVRILLGVIETKAVHFRMHQEARDLGVGFEGKNETSGQIILRILQLRFGNGFVDDPADFRQQ